MHTMKATPVILLLLALLCIPVTSLAALPTSALTGTITTPTPDDLPMETAITLAITALDDPAIKSLPSQATLITNAESGTHTWLVSFFAEGTPPPAGVALIASPAGTIIATTTEPFMSIEAALEAARGSQRFWSLQDQAIFDALCKTPSAYPRSIIPTDAPITQDEAFLIAQQSLCAAYNLAPGALDAFEPSFSFVRGYTQNPEAPALDEIWIVSFYSNMVNEYQANLSANTGEVYLLYASGDANS